MAVVRRLGRQQLIGEAAESPDVNLFRVLNSLSDLGGDPGWCALLTHPVLILLAQEHAKSKVGKLDRAIGSAENIVGLNVSMQDVFDVHGLESESRLVQAPSNEVLAELATHRKNDISHGAALHVVQEHPDTTLVIVNFRATDELLAVEVSYQTALVDHILTLLHVSRLRELQSELHLVLDPLHLHDLPESALA